MKYDTSTKAIPYINYAKQTRNKVLWLYNQHRNINVVKDDIKKVVLILSASRSGSSLLYDVLKQSDQLMSLEGETTPFYKLHQCCFPFNELQSDILDTKNSYCTDQLDNIFNDILYDIGIGGQLPNFKPDGYFFYLVRRLALQWPQIGLSIDQWIHYINASYHHFTKEHNRWNTDLFYISLIKKIQCDYPDINVCYYDLSDERTLNIKSNNFSNAPPNDTFCIEEPPFVMAQPRKRPDLKAMKTLPLILKSTVDLYRISFIKQLFPSAEFQYLVLTRNPAASINGLYRGWLHRGFFSHNLKNKATLKIAGYSDCFKWGNHWWNFDLPPGWKKTIQSPLEYVCGFQWYSANKYIIENTQKESQTNIMRIKFEDFIQSSKERYYIVKNIANFIGIDCNNHMKKYVNVLPVVMATDSPSNVRWKQMKDKIEPVINQKDINYLSRYLGYS